MTLSAFYNHATTRIPKSIMGIKDAVLAGGAIVSISTK